MAIGIQWKYIYKSSPEYINHNLIGRYRGLLISTCQQIRAAVLAAFLIGAPSASHAITLPVAVDVWIPENDTAAANPEVMGCRGLAEVLEVTNDRVFAALTL